MRREQDGDVFAVCCNSANHSSLAAVGAQKIRRFLPQNGPQCLDSGPIFLRTDLAEHALADPGSNPCRIQLIGQRSGDSGQNENIVTIAVGLQGEIADVD